MPATFPLTLVYQEIEQVSVSVGEAELPSLIVGPAYHIRDFPADKDDIQFQEYGTKEGDNDPNLISGVTGVPGPGATVVTLSDPPDNATGAVLDHSSVEVWADVAWVQITNSSDDSTQGSIGGGAISNEFEADSSRNLGGDGVAVGDKLIVTNASGDTEEFIISEVKTGADDHKALLNKNPTISSPTAVDWRIERKFENIQIDASFYSLSNNELTLKGGITHSVDVTGDGSPESLIVSYANVHMAYRSLRQDLAKITEVSKSNQESVLGDLDERNPLRVGAKIALDHSGDAPIQVWGLTGDDLNGQTTLSTSFNAMLDQISTREDIYVINALTYNTSVRGSLLSHVNAYSAPDRGRFRIAILGYGPLVKTKTVSGPAVDGTAGTVAGDSEYVLEVLSAGGGQFETNGVSAGDTISIIYDSALGVELSGTWEIDKVFDETRLYIEDSTFAGVTRSANTQDIAYFVLENGTGETIRRVDIDVLTADPLTTVSSGLIADDIGKVLRLTGVSSGSNGDLSPSGDDLYYIKDDGSGAPELYADGGVNWDSDATITAEIVEPKLVVEDTSPESAERRAEWRVLTSATATFVSDGAIATDLLEIPDPPVSEGSDFDAVYSAEIESVDFETQVTLVPGTDIPQTTSGSTAQTDIGYRIRRPLDKEEQKDELLTVVDGASGFEEKRLVLVWPDVVNLEGVQNARTGLSSRQPGYYLASAIAGLSAGLPAHQPMTRTQLSGFEELFHSSGYFNEDQLIEISNAGFFLVLKENQSSAPYIAHQLTTDTSSITTQELSLVRTFDFVSSEYKKAIDTFIGRYNINATTLDMLVETIDLVTDRLKSQRLPKIGAPVIDANVLSLEPIAANSDHVEAIIDIDFPEPLNRATLRLRA